MTEVATRGQGVLSEAKLALLESRLRKAGVAVAETIPRRRDSGPAELSHAQQRLWFLDQLEPGSAAYNVATGIVLSGPLDQAVLERSLNEVVRRHEALRTAFETVAGHPVQTVCNELALRLPLLDLRALPEVVRGAEARRQAAIEAGRGFDLRTGPLVRGRVLCLAEDEHAVLLTMHHIVSDGWSMGVLIRELSVLYTAFAGGRPSPLPELPIQYPDFACWHRQWLRGGVLAAQMVYWKQHLRHCAPLLDLPLDKPRPAVQTERGAREPLSVPGPVREGLERLARREGATLFMTLLAAFQVLLGRYAGTADVIVGTPISGRNRRELEGMIGFFVNTLVTRADLSGNPAAAELVRRARVATLGAYAHQDIPFESLVEELQPQRSLSHHPLFQVMFVFENETREELRLPGLTLRPLTADRSVAKFELTLVLREAAGGLEGDLEYNVDLFTPDTLRRMAGHLGRLLAGMAGDPEARVLELPLLTDTERRQLTAGWSGAPAAGGPEPCLHELFEQLVERAPAAIALALDDEQLSYGELDRRANQLARHLRGLGVGPEVRVGICVEPSSEMVVGLLGILKAGGAYVPLDPQSPRERTRFLLEDAGVAALLTQERLLGTVPELAGPVVCLDRDGEVIARQGVARLPAGASAGNLAYVIYTSGSTGAPKGVGVTVGELARHAAGAGVLWGLRAADSVLQLTPLAFDPSAEQIFTTLLGGARLILAGRELWTAPELLEHVRRLGISIADLPTAYWSAVVDEWSRRGEGGGSLRVMIVGGEALRREPALRWRSSSLSAVRLLNAYGPTEATITATVLDVSAGAEIPGGHSVPIGRALAGRRAWVIDAAGDLAPVGLAGELCLGGGGLARGYLGRAGLTAERFAPDPFGEAGSRLYRTGDLARLLADGNLEFLGRLDEQVKVRGFRVEPGEIEAVLAVQGEVGASAVVAREDRPGERRLVAYVVGKEGRRPQPARLREHVRSKLPAHLVPAVFVVLESLPLAPGGKVDRRALPVPEPDAEERRPPVAPRTVEEADLARIWSEVLGAASVGVEDNFFTLGGDSILSIQVVSRAREAGYLLTVKDLFRRQTIAELAEGMRSAAPQVAQPLEVVGPVALTPIQSWFFAQEPPCPHHYNQAVLLAVREPADAAALAGAVRELVRHHDALRLRFVLDGDEWRQWNAGEEAEPAGLFTQVDLTRDEDWPGALAADVSRVQASLSLADGSLLRVVHYRLGPAGERLLAVVHHLVVDGVSWRILLADLQRAYEQLRAGNPAELPAKTTSFQEWARRLAEHAQSGALAAEAEHWTAPVVDRSPGWEAARLPVDRAGGANTVASVRRVSVALGEEETRALLQEVPRAYRTQIDEVLLAALALAVGSWSGQPRLLVDLEGHGREELFEGVDLSRTVGWFTTLYPVALNLAGVHGADEVLKAVKEQVRSVPRRGIGYGLLRYLGPAAIRERLAALPQAEISFNYLGQLDQVLAGASPFAGASEPHGATEAPQTPRRYAIDVDALVGERCLSLSWAYSSALHDEATIAALAESFLAALRGLIRHCRSPGAGSFTPSDFPLAGLDQRQLDRCLAGARDVEDLYPLSPMQQGMLFHSLSAPRSGHYVEQVSCRIGGIDAAAFRRAWQAVVDRHPILRTSFVWQGLPEPLQVVRRQVPLCWEDQDWSGLPDSDQRERLEELLRADRARGFALDAAPLLRLALLRTGPDAYVLVWSHHHALLDGWCTGLFFRELFAVYDACRRGDEPHLARPRPYRDYIAWLRGQDLAQAEQFWRQGLAGFRTPTPLPERSSGPDVADREEPHGEELRRLPRETTLALEAFARRHQLTLNTVLQGAWAVLLSRSSGEQDVVFGAVVSGRPAELAGVTTMLGLFINALPVRVRVLPDEPVAGSLRALQEQQVEARQYEYSPLANVQRWSEVPPGTPLFESLMVFENYPVDESIRNQAGQALGITAVRNDERTNYPLTLVASPGTELPLRLDYDKRRIEPLLVRRWLGHLVSLLGGVVRAEGARWRDLALMSEAERCQVLVEWNDTAWACPSGLCIHELFAEEAARSPEAAALVFGRERLSYRELAGRADQLARHLRSLGVAREVRVGICVERSVAMVVGMLAILKSGAAYVPLDPEYPAERLRFLLEDSGVELVLTHERAASRLPDGVLGGLPAVCLDRDAETILRHSAEPLELWADPDQIAYVMYTSGSTGRPKGVAVTHRGVVRLVRGTGWLRIDPQDVVLHLATASFDATTWEVWGPLLNGARLALMPPGTPGLDDLSAALGAYGVSVLLLPVPLFNLMVDRRAVDLRRVRQVLVGGDALSPVHVERYLAGLGEGAALINAYGPTEGTTITCCQRLRGGDKTEGRVPIGRPIGNTQAYVLDGGMSPCPIGEPGELYAGGAGLARCYWNSPGLTAAKLVPDPFGEPGSRLYRTGDLARTLGDGRLEFLGRMDQQVKVRGFRVEPGEIETVLRDREEVGEAVVVAREDRPGDKRLVAYVVGKDGRQPEVGRLREHVASRLPEHMVPSAFVVLESLPLTASGKVDRRLLPAPELGAVDGSAHVAPRTDVEVALARSWSEVLGVERVGVEDRFFELGGDSILSIQVVARARELGYQLTVRQLFEHPTVAELARVAQPVAQCAASQEPVTGPVPLTPIQVWFLSQRPAHPHHFNQSVLLELRGRVEGAALEGAVRELVRHHDALRLRFERGGNGWRQWNAGEEEGAVFSRIELAGVAEWERALEADASLAQASLNLTAGPMLRAVHYDLGTAGGRLLLVVHHLAVDGVSWRILLADLQRAYEQLSHGQPVKLAAKTTSFQEWALRLDELAQSSALAAEEPVWTSRRSALRLPVDHPDGANTAAAAARVAVALSEEETRSLLQEVPAVYRTQIDEVLLAALVEAVAEWSGERRLWVNLEGHGREELFEGVDLSRTVGWFTSLYPVMLDVESVRGVGEVLKAVKEQVRGVPRRGIGYGLLRYLGPPATRQRLAALPQAEISFNYLGQFDQVLPSRSLFGVAGEPHGRAEAPEALRNHLLDVGGLVADGRLRMDWTYSEAQYERETIERLAGSFLQKLKDMIEHCKSPEAGGCTPSDFPLALLAQAELDRCIGAGRGVEDVYPLSPAQEGLLFHSLYAPQSGIYVVQLSCRIERMEAGPFKQAWQAVVDGHPILRTSFAWEGLPEPLQVVRRDVELEWREEDWRALTPAEQDRRGEELLRQDRERGFDLGRAPLLRLALFRTGADACQLLWTYHHLLLDGWCTSLVFKELFAFYDSFRRGETPRLERPRPYREYVAWLRRQDRGQAEAFWRNALQGFSAPTRLGREAGPEEGQGEEVLHLSRKSTEALEDLARRLQVTLNTVLQGAWALLLSRYAGEDDVVFGATVAGRPADLTGAASMLGLFINTLPVRVLVRPQQRAAELLKTLQQQQAEARQYEHSSLVDIQGWSEVPRGTPLFESLLVFENYPVDQSVRKQAGQTLGISAVRSHDRTNYPLTVVAVAGAELQVCFDYERGRFETGRVSGIARHLGNLLAGIAANPEALLMDLPLLSSAESRELLAAANAVPIEHPAARCIHELFAEQVERRPDAVAVVFERAQLSYRELDHRANRLARRLRRLGVGPEVCVALCLERSLELVVALLAVLKAGGVYVPLDPDHPEERLGYILKDSGACMLLTQARLLARLPDMQGPVLCLDRDWSLIAGEEAPQPSVESSPDHAAYIIYTSGSTGRPKGVLVTHRNVTRLFLATEDRFLFGPGDRGTLFHSYAFDFSVWECWSALAYGGCLVVVPFWLSRSPDAFLGLLRDEQVTMLSQTPSAFYELIRAEREQEPVPLALRLVVFGGEALDYQALRPWLERHGDALPRLVNMYGITETTVHVSVRPVVAADVTAGPGGWIGGPIPDLSLHVLGSGLEVMPAGVPGELYVGGAGLARGYMGRPDLTAERFVPDPFTSVTGARLYRSGDLGARRADGDIVYRGRGDAQVKIRGFRIEIGEIEMVLAACPGVERAVVILSEDTPGDRRLIAYLAGPSLEDTDLKRVRELAAARLPAYMLPSACVLLTSLPVTANGKVDRRALPVPPGFRAELKATYMAPRTPLERQMAEMWAEVLKVERVGVEDNFFDLGGHSLTATRLVARLRSSLGVDIALRTLFETPTIAGLAEAVGRALPVADEPAGTIRRLPRPSSASRPGKNPTEGRE
jgi:amino acid adenylation domain-containing protein/non-ribosomal peptide synthase protein (TIGR01720 family)